MTPEGRIKQRVKRALTQTFGKHAWYFMPVQNGMGKPGLDFFVCLYGHFVAIETKVPGKELTLRQQSTMAEIDGARGLTFVIHGEDEIESMIRELVVLERTYNGP